MKKEFKLSEIDIGYADGEKEADGKNFLDIFYNENNKYEEIMKKYMFIISGRKGTGKTVLAKYIQKNNKCKTQIIEYTKISEISLHEYIDIEKINVSDDDRFLFQEYYIYKQLLLLIRKRILHMTDFLMDNVSFFQKIKKFFDYFGYKKLIKKINNYFNELYQPGSPYETMDIKDVRKILDTIETQTDANFSNSKFGFRGASSLEYTNEINSIRKNFAKRLEDYKSFVSNISKYIGFILIIDDLDEIKTTSKEHSLYFLINFVKKINEINITLNSCNNKSKCIVLLRSDIISKFSAMDHNIQKILNDCTVELKWFSQTNKDELAHMIMHKIKHSVSSDFFSKMSYEEMHKQLFPCEGKKSKDKIKYGDGFKYIFDHSFGRPRDIINYLKVVIKNYPNKDKFELQDIIDSLQDYSVSFLNELKNEMSFSFDYKEIEDIFELLKRFGKKEFNYEDIKGYYSQNLVSYPNINELDYVLNYLYELGAIGNIRNIGKKGKKYYSWSYRDNARSTLEFSERIIIHKGLIRALNI